MLNSILMNKVYNFGCYEITRVLNSFDTDHFERYRLSNIKE